MTDLDQEISAVLHRVAEREEMPDFVMPTATAAPKSKVRPNKRIWQRWASMSIATAGAALLVVGVGTYASPDFASTVQSWMGQGEKGTDSHLTKPLEPAQISPELVRELFGQESFDRGIERAALQGFAQAIHASTIDQGITLEVKAIMADPTRVFVSYVIKNEDGSLIDPKQLTRYPDKVLALTDDKDQRLTNGYGGGWDEVSYTGYLSFYLEDQKRAVPESMNLLIDVKKIGTVQGHWKLEIPISLKSAMAATRTYPVESEYVTSQGLHIALHTVKQTPSSTAIVLETQWDEAAKNRLAQYASEMTGKTQNPDYAPFVPYQQYQLEYQVLDKNGKDVTAYQQTGKRLEQGLLKDGSESRDQYGHFIWNTAYVPFEADGPFTFVLDAVHVAEPADAAFSFEPEKLLTEPMDFEYEGSRFTIKGLKKDETQTPARTELEVEVAHRDISYIHHVWWELTDQSGKSYPINGASFDVIGMDTEGREIMQIGLSVEDMEDFPKQLTLSLSAVSKRYADVDWSVELPLK